MNRGAKAALALALIALLLGGARLFAGHESGSPASSPHAERPRLGLITSLPLLFGEQFGLDRPSLPALRRIQHAYQLVPLGVADAASLKRVTRLLMAHPRAQPAEYLVELDDWVRHGGHVVLLADPQLRWESSRSMGDPLRPPPDFADTGLLAHWGLRLALNEAGEGELRATSATCTVNRTRLVAMCRVGRGTARVIADADFIMAPEGTAEPRIDLLLDQLAASDSR